MNKNHAKSMLKKALSVLMAFVLLFSTAIPAFAAETGSLSVDGLTAKSSSKGTIVLASNSADITATSTGWSSQTATLQLTNTSGQTATLSFDYEIVQSSNTIKVGGTTVTSNGTFSKEITNGATIEISVKASAYNTSQLKISNIKLFSNVDVTTTFVPSENGAYTVSGEQITAETAKTQLASEAYTVTVTPASGYQFLGWFDVDTDEPLGLIASGSITFDKSRKVTAKFVDSSLALFETGSVAFDDLNEASAYATKTGTTQITLLNSGSVSAGDYVIPAGKTLLIPHDSSNVVYTEAQSTGYNGIPVISATAVGYTKPTAYRTLTMQSGANLTVNGAICVGGRHCIALNYSGVPSQTVGMINMKEGSSITLNNGASLYCWGFIYGGGEITAKSGSAVHENFQFPDFRGGSATSSMATDYAVFPLSQYYVQNVEVATTYEYGAREKVWTSIFMSKQEFGAGVDFIGDGAMFVPSEGSSLTKTYDPKTDRLKIEINGSANINSMSLSLGGSNINSQEFPLPINSNISIEIHSGTTNLSQTIAMLPGSTLTIDKGAELLLATGEAGSGYSGGENLFIYDRDEWYYGLDTETEEVVDGKFVYSNRYFNPVPYSPTRSYNRADADLTDCVIDINGTLTTEGFAYTTAGGAQVISSEKTGKVVLINGAGVDEFTVQANQADTTITYLAIPMTSIALKNADGGYTDTSGAQPGATYVYSEKLDQWRTPCDTHTAGEAVKENEVAGNCTTNSSYDSVVYCTECGVEISREFVTIQATGHNETAKETAPTCETEGYTTYTCTVCTQTRTADTVAALGHTWSDPVFTWAKDNKSATATHTCGTCKKEENLTVKMSQNVQSVDSCEEAGITIYTAKVTIGEINYTELRKVTGTALGHSFTTYTDYEEASCGKTATRISECDNKCGETNIIEVENTALTHSFTTFTYDETLGKHTSVCDNCKTETLTQECTAGDWIVDQSATCTIGGSKHKECTKCSHVMETETIPVAEHNFVSQITKPTCTEGGYTTHTCTECTYSYKDTETPASGHKGGAATCKTLAACSVCGVAYGEINANNHESQETYTVKYAEATCTAEGYTGDKHYVCCDALAQQGEKTEKIPHNYKEESPDEAHLKSAATCSKNAVYYYECTACDAISPADTFEVEGFNAVNHVNTTDIPAKPETCTEDGYTAYTLCNDCEEKIGKVILPQTGHNYTTEKKEENITRPVLTNGVWSEGVCKYPCLNDGCDAFITETFQRANYEDYNQIVADLNDLITRELLPAYSSGVEKIQAALTENAVDDNLMTYEQSIIDAAYENLLALYEQYSDKVITYTVVFYTDYNDRYNSEYIIEKQVRSGDGVTAPTEDEINFNRYPDRIQYGYHLEFKGWSMTDEQLSSITGDMAYQQRVVVYAQFNTVEHTGGTAYCDIQAECDVCGANYGEFSTTNHKEEFLSQRNAKEPTCRVDGYTAYTYCSSCRAEIGKEVLPKSDEYHKFTNYNGREAGTCQKNAQKVATCDYGCGTKAYIEIPDSKEDHLFSGAASIQPTTEGYHDYACYYGCGTRGGETRCTSVRDEDKATCIKNNTCSFCHAQYGLIASTRHVNTIDMPGKESTCTEKGYYDYQYCYDCQQEIYKRERPLAEHDYDLENGVITYPTPTEVGYYTYTCKNCPKTKTEFINKTGLTVLEGETFYLRSTYYTAQIGLKRIVTESGEINYYYFDPESGKAFKAVGDDNGCVVVYSNNLLVAGIRYHFDENGVILHDDTSRNGIVMNEDGYMYDYIDGVRIPRGLFERDGNFYYARTSNGIIVCDTRYYVSVTNGHGIASGYYMFDENGVMVKNGFVKQDGKLYYYVNGKMFTGGLFKVGDNYYYAKTSTGEVAASCKYWVSVVNDIPAVAGQYTFDENGVITDLVFIGDEKDGFIKENDALYYYVNGIKSFGGLMLINGDYYYISTSTGKVVCSTSYWVSATNGLMNQGIYTFDENGKMLDPKPLPDTPVVVKNGIVSENGSLYYYVDGKLNYAGLIMIEGDYYYVKTSTAEVINGKKYWVSVTNGFDVKQGCYEFDAEGKMIIA